VTYKLSLLSRRRFFLPSYLTPISLFCLSIFLPGHVSPSILWQLIFLIFGPFFFATRSLFLPLPSSLDKLPGAYKENDSSHSLFFFPFFYPSLLSVYSHYFISFFDLSSALSRFFAHYGFYLIVPLNLFKDENTTRGCGLNFFCPAGHCGFFFLPSFLHTLF